MNLWAAQNPQPPTKLRLTIKGQAKIHRGSMSGVYVIQSSQENVVAHPHWKQICGSNSVWFDAILGTWNVGWTKNLATDKYGMYSLSKVGLWPHDKLFGNWKYFNGNEFIDSGEDILFDDYSEGKYRICTDVGS